VCGDGHDKFAEGRKDDAQARDTGGEEDEADEGDVLTPVDEPSEGE
jgi:hypothetical protein